MISVIKDFWLYSFQHLFGQVIYSKDSVKGLVRRNKPACPVGRLRMIIQLSIITTEKPIP